MMAARVAATLHPHTPRPVWQGRRPLVVRRESCARPPGLHRLPTTLLRRPGATPPTQAGPPTPPPSSSSSVTPSAAVALASASAILGPCCDTLHSRWGVLTYTNPTISAPPFLVSCWWVPLMFSGAGLIIGLGVPFLDAVFSAGGDGKEATVLPPAQPWPRVLACIAGFVSLYGASAVLEAPLRASPGALDVILAAGAFLHWAVFDRTPAAAVLGAAAALAGPAVEVGLIKAGLYTYADAAFLGTIPTWIWTVYFAGGAAVGGLGRRVVADLEEKREESV